MTSVLVIGAGIGGIAAAARLARAGYQVTVIEKNARPGGRCDQIVRDGHRFDVGPSIFLMPEVSRRRTGRSANAWRTTSICAASTRPTAFASTIDRRSR